MIFVPLIIRCFATIKFSEFCIIAPNHQNQGIFAQCVFETEKIEIESYHHCNRIFIVLFCRIFKPPIQNIQSQRELSDFRATVFDISW